MKKTLIQNAVIYDGTGNRPFHADVLINGPRIEKIGRRIAPQAGDTVVDAGGLALAPGFINPHSHMELELLKNPSLHQVVDQGI
ncbi:MAG: D-aminoacylase, partial [Oscillospiraceae bacterium]